MVKELPADTTQAGFDEELAQHAGKVVVVDFFATWCGPCKMIAPKLEAIEKDSAEKLVVLKIDVDDCPELAEALNISAMPTFFIYKNGSEVSEVVGANETKLKEAINAQL
uniref:Thioredoxin n=1 Tax=Haliotis diversicolor supertexta TaxID=283615 RepID=E6Y2Z4_HALDV|nr:thioredoxin [Haliotis diversicolor supertexta]